MENTKDTHMLIRMTLAERKLIKSNAKKLKYKSASEFIRETCTQAVEKYKEKK